MGFKIGDKVVCNRGSNTLRVGKEYVVQALDEDMDVAVVEVPGYWAQDRFVLVPRQQDETVARMVRKCDNCGRTGTRCTRRVIDGVVVWDCLKCWPSTDQEADRKAQTSTYTFNDEQRPVRQTPQVRCAICHVKAPRAVVNDHPAPGGILRQNGSKAEQNNLNGWGLMEFPFRDDYFNVWRGNYKEGTLPRSKFAEKDKLCPECATKVKAYIAHLKHPPLSEEDL